MTSGTGTGLRASGSGFLRFLPLTGGIGGSTGSGLGAGSFGGPARGEGGEDAGEREVMSMEGDNWRVLEPGELGDGESSGGGDGGKIKWNVLEAICIDDLGIVFIDLVV